MGSTQRSAMALLTGAMTGSSFSPVLASSLDICAGLQLSSSLRAVHLCRQCALATRQAGEFSVSHCACRGMRRRSAAGEGGGVLVLARAPDIGVGVGRSAQQLPLEIVAASGGTVTGLAAPGGWRASSDDGVPGRKAAIAASPAMFAMRHQLLRWRSTLFSVARHLLRVP